MNDERKIAQKSYLKNAGITLIALVITIIILLILAGVSIATLTGNNGILTQTTEAKTETRANSVKEARDLWETNKTMDQRTGTSTAQTLEQLVDDLTAQGLLTEDEKDKIIGNEEKGIEAQYGITIGKTVITFSRPIAKVEPDNISDWEYTIDDDGFATITCYKGNDTKIVIPNSINGVDVKRVNSDNGISNKKSHSIWADSICKEKGKYSSTKNAIGNGTIIEVTVSEGIEEIGSEAFNSSVALKKLNLPTTIKKLGYYIIEYCPSLTELNIPYGITTIGSVAFCGGDSSDLDDVLETIKIPESVTTIESYAFGRRKGLKNINIPKTVTNIADSAFAQCQNILNIDVDDENPNYKTIDGMLYSKDGKKLIRGVNKENIIIPDQTNIIGRDAFSMEKSITTVKVSNSVKMIGAEAFYGCESLTNIMIADNVTKIESGAFGFCKSLKEITIPKNVVEMGGYMFEFDTITVNVYFKENEKPDTWDDNWNYTWPGYGAVTVNYAQ